MSEQNLNPEQLYPLPFRDVEQLRLKLVEYQSKLKDLGLEFAVANDIVNIITVLSHKLQEAIDANKEISTANKDLSAKVNALEVELKTLNDLSSIPPSAAIPEAPLPG